jgi:hypothetical protein
LENWFNPQAYKSIDYYNHGRETSLVQVHVSLFTTDLVMQPSIYEESLNFEKKQDKISLKETTDN